MPLITSTVKVSMLGRQDESGKWRFSMRSKGDIDIGEIARQFGGGGHMNAAGFNYTGEVEQLVKELIESLSGRLDSDAEKASEL